ncbi:histidine phosphatase family protein [Nocardia africana]|uniref:histidine phosphatase family protein n=1 Tax=Nocardia africana TaxID=134964 RepID=UPI0007A3AF32|nr:histidine phosphatase family protein [Nocardia africana]MCC3313869.1 histidine phosphatase family protein [Nocardia africana]
MTGPTARAEYRQPRFQPPAGSTELLLIRHGESAPARADQPFPLLEGQGDPELAPEGRRQAEAVAARLGAERIDAIYVTPFRRTMQTAAPLTVHLGLPPRVAADLREVHLGDWEGGLFRKMVADRHPVAQRMQAEERWDVIPGAEPAAEFTTRVRRAVERLAHEHPGRRLAVFTHGGVIAQVLSQASGSRPFAFHGVDNGSVSHVVVTAESWIVRCFNDTSHLGTTFSRSAAPLT